MQRCVCVNEREGEAERQRERAAKAIETERNRGNERARSSLCDRDQTLNESIGSGAEEGTIDASAPVRPGSSPHRHDPQQPVCRGAQAAAVRAAGAARDKSARRGPRPRVSDGPAAGSRGPPCRRARCTHRGAHCPPPPVAPRPPSAPRPTNINASQGRKALQSRDGGSAVSFCRAEASAGPLRARPPRRLCPAGATPRGPAPARHGAVRRHHVTFDAAEASPDCRPGPPGR